MHALDQYMHQINVQDYHDNCWRYWNKISGFHILKAEKQIGSRPAEQILSPIPTGGGTSAPPACAPVLKSIGILGSAFPLFYWILTNKYRFDLNPYMDTIENHRLILVLEDEEQHSKDFIEKLFLLYYRSIFTRSSFEGNLSYGISNTRNWLSSLFVNRQRPSGDLKVLKYRIFIN